MRKYCEDENIYLEILTDLPVFSPPEYEKMVFGMLSFHLYMSVCLWASLVPDQLNRFDSYLTFNNFSIVG
jgi:hypothetical protein